jgi:hypothetical protein
MDMHEIEELAQMFDSIITSRNEAVQQSFRSLVVLAKLSEQNENYANKKQSATPFHDLTTRLKWMEEQFQHIKRDVQILQNNSRSPRSYPTIDPTMIGAAGSYSYDPSTITLSGLSSALDISQLKALTTQDVMQMGLTQASVDATIEPSYDLFSNSTDSK